MREFIFSVEYTNSFKKDYKRIVKRGYNILMLREVVVQLSKGFPLGEDKRDHALSGNWSGYRQCHIAPDWLLIYQIVREEQVITLTRTGTHSDLFE